MSQDDVQYNKWKNSGALGKIYNPKHKAYIIATVRKPYFLVNVQIYSEKYPTVKYIVDTVNILIEEYTGRTFHSAARKAREHCASWIKPWIIYSRNTNYLLYARARSNQITLPADFWELADKKFAEQDAYYKSMEELCEPTSQR